MFGLWAKLRCGIAGSYHPLICHLLDVAAVTEALWTHALPEAVRRRVCRSLGGAGEDEAQANLAIWAGLHDLGKASPSFQGLDPATQQRLAADGFPFRVSTRLHHGIVSAVCVAELLQKAGYDPPIARALGVAVGGHHGSFPSGRSLDALRRDLGTGRWERARADLFEALRTQLQAPAPRLPDGLSADDHPFFMLLSGLISVADWIGSSEVHFPFAPDTTDPTAYLADAREMARCALDELGWTGWAPPAEPANFGDLFPGLMPRPMQVQVAELCPEMDGPGLVLIEAPMGEGKTEAAFLLADHWNHALRQRGCYVAMPTQATANAMFARFRDGYLARRHPKQASRLQLLHGNAVLSARLEQLAQVGAVHGEGDASGRDGATEAREWFSHRKRGLLGPFAVGTVDQALLGVLQTRHVFVRLFGLAGKTLVLDEVHAFDTYTSELIDRLLAWAGALDCSVVLLSATLPRKRREGLVRAYAGAQASVPDAKYPRVTWAAKGAVRAAHVHAERGRRIRLQWAPAEVSTVAEHIAHVISAGGCVGWVCNTVARAQQAALAMREALAGTGAECDLFHARFPFSERDRREKRALKRFGKQDRGRSRRPHAAVLVATQVIEQSLDVDFDLLVTDLAPVDLLLQRSGRMHRHDLPRPERLRDPTVWIISPEADGPRPRSGPGRPREKPPLHAAIAG